MPKIKINHHVHDHFIAIKEKFNLDLFIKLTPPLARCEVTRFDGCQKNDEVHLTFYPMWKLRLRTIKFHWVSLITKASTSENEFQFIDEGKRMPWPFKSWHHHHLVIKVDESQSLIVDDIEYKTHSTLIDYLAYPGLYFTFFMRRGVYRTEFNNIKKKIS